MAKNTAHKQTQKRDTPFSIPNHELGKQHITITCSPMGWKQTKLRLAMGDNWQGDSVIWSDLGEGYFKITFLNWVWAGCRGTSPQQWATKAGFTVLQTDINWAPPTTRVQGTEHFTQLQKTLSYNTKRV